LGNATHERNALRRLKRGWIEIVDELPIDGIEKMEWSLGCHDRINGAVIGLV
jgi:hypothetical protein